MTLETLAKDIAASAEAQAKAMLKEAKAEADAIVGEAETNRIFLSVFNQVSSIANCLSLF